MDFECSQGCAEAFMVSIHTAAADTGVALTSVEQLNPSRVMPRLWTSRDGLFYSYTVAERSVPAAAASCPASIKPMTAIHGGKSMCSCYLPMQLSRHNPSLLRVHTLCYAVMPWVPAHRLRRL